VEAGGAILNNENVVKPGWVLQLPPDATGDGVRTGPLPQPDDAPGLLRAATASPTPAPTTPGAASHQATPAKSLPTTLMVSVGVGVLVVALLALAVWAARTGRLAIPRRLHRRRAAPATHPDSPATATVERSLRAIATACAAAGHAPPGLYAVVVGPDHIRLRLSSPADDPPAGFHAEDDGRTWRGDLKLLESAAVDASLDFPYPRLVTLGTTTEGHVLLHLGEGDGIICLDGDPDAARDLADLWTKELASNPWSHAVPVLHAGLSEADIASPPPGATSMPQDEQAHDNMPDGAGVLILSRPPRESDLDDLTSLTTRDQDNWAVIALGNSPAARWRLTVTNDHRIETGLLTETLHTTGRLAMT
jgi:hypothetical protein